MKWKEKKTYVKKEARNEQMRHYFDKKNKMSRTRLSQSLKKGKTDWEGNVPSCTGNVTDHG